MTRYWFPIVVTLLAASESFFGESKDTALWACMCAFMCWECVNMGVKLESAKRRIEELVKGGAHARQDDA